MRRLMILLAAAARRAAGLQQARAASCAAAGVSQRRSTMLHRVDAAPSTTSAPRLASTRSRRQPPPTRRSASASNACATTATRSPRRDATGGTSGGLGPNDLRRPHATFNGRRRLRAGRLVRRVRIQRRVPELPRARIAARGRGKGARKRTETPELRLPPVQRECRPRATTRRPRERGRAARAYHDSISRPSFQEEAPEAARLHAGAGGDNIKRSICASPISASVYVASDVLGCGRGDAGAVCGA